MTRLLYFGRGGKILDTLLQNGCAQVESIEHADVVLVETHDNHSPNPIERLDGTIGLVRKALDEIEQSSTHRMVVITDQSSTSGSKREGATTGVAIDDVHGFGTLTAEVLGRRAANLGIITKVYRLHSDSVQEGISEIQSSLLEENDSCEYEVITLGA